MPQSPAEALPGRFPLKHQAREVAPRRAARPSRRGEARSLFGEILDWMFAPLLLLWPMSVTITYLVAQSIASGPYDRNLVERGEALAAHVHFEAPRDGAHPRFDMTPGLLELAGANDSNAFVVLAQDGTVLAGDRDLALSIPPPGPSGNEVSSESFQLRDQNLRGHPMRVAYAWLQGPNGRVPGPGAPVLVAVAESPADRRQLANEIVKGVILPQFVVLPLALVLVWFGLTRGLAPLSRLQQTIRERRPEDLSPIQSESAPEEIAPLLASFNELLARMTHNVGVQKRFIADAAHQMKTPLAGLRTQAELAQRETDAQELQRSLRQIAAASEGATRLVDQLLALARAEHNALEPGTVQAVDIAELARSVVRDWVPQAMNLGLDLGYEGPVDGTSPCWIEGAPLLLREMLNNLIDNALRYADAGSVTVRVRRTAHATLLEVEDAGPGIAPEDRAHVFERFYRVLGTRRDGSGLGLAIVREIAAQHKASVELLDAAPGALFRIAFAPSARRGAHARSV